MLMSMAREGVGECGVVFWDIVSSVMVMLLGCGLWIVELTARIAGRKKEESV